MKYKPLDKKQALCLRGGSIYYWGGHIQSAVYGLTNDIKTKDLEADNIKDARRKMCKLIEYWFPDIRTKINTKEKVDRSNPNVR